MEFPGLFGPECFGSVTTELVETRRLLPVTVWKATHGRALPSLGGASSCTGR